MEDWPTDTKAGDSANRQNHVAPVLVGTGIECAAASPLVSLTLLAAHTHCSISPTKPAIGIRERHAEPECPTQRRQCIR
jgi:hypothetical protein